MDSALRFICSLCRVAGSTDALKVDLVFRATFCFGYAVINLAAPRHTTFLKAWLTKPFITPENPFARLVPCRSIPTLMPRSTTLVSKGVGLWMRLTAP